MHFADRALSALTKQANLAPLSSAIAELPPVAPPLFPAGQVTDRDLAFRIAETIREKLTLELDQELPYGIAVEIEAMGHDDGQLECLGRHLGGPGRSEADRHRRGRRALEARGPRGAPGAQPCCWASVFI